MPCGYDCLGMHTAQLPKRGSVLFCALGEAAGSPSPPCSPVRCGTGLSQASQLSHGGGSSYTLNALSSASDSEGPSQVGNDLEPELDAMLGALARV